MHEVSNEMFNDLIAQSLDELPEEYTSHLGNVLITYEDNPTYEQREKLKLQCNQTLFGLYEGVPMTVRGSGYSGMLPDKITIFKDPMVHTSTDINSLKVQVKHTLWHEIAHHFGLSHDQIHEIEDRWQ